MGVYAAKNSASGEESRVQDFVRFFNDDPEQAIAAIQHYNAAERSITTLPRRSNPLITVHNVTKSYAVGQHIVTALNGVSLDIYKGEIVALTGASGSGKSTLLHILGCIDRPTTGQVIIDNQDVTKLHDAALSSLRSATIGFVFQSFYLQPFLRLQENIAVPAMFTHAQPKTIKPKVTKLLTQVGLAERAMHYPKELSGGQIQRAAIARALINDPPVVLADEPTGNLDSAASKAIIDLFKTIREQLGTTIIIVTHDHDIARQADRIITLKDGVII
jgi:ABC-type lipoprotein export system ATPase subunit